MFQNPGIHQRPTASALAPILGMTIALLLSVSPCPANDSFVQAVDTASPDHRVVTDPSTRRLLEEFKPQIYVDPTSYRPLSFYEDYLPNTVLKRSNGRTVDGSPDRSVLESVKNRTGFYLDYRIPPEQHLSDKENVTPTVYGRVYRDTVTVKNRNQPLIFLKYSVAFPYSGLPYDVNRAKWIGSYVLGNPYAWHELDIHGAVYVILNPTRCVPLGVVLAQHNYHRTLWRKHDFTWPDTKRVKISYATNSNEPYILTESRRTRTVRTVGNPENLPWVYGRGSAPILDAGFDRVLAPEDGSNQITTRLKILRKTDPLYTARIPLGDRGRLFYFWPHWTREGPPGVNYYAPPRLIDLSNLTAFFDVEPDDDTFWQLYRSSNKSFREFPGDQLMHHQLRKLRVTLNSLQGLRGPVGQHCTGLR